MIRVNYIPGMSGNYRRKVSPVCLEMFNQNRCQAPIKVNNVRGLHQLDDDTKVE